MFQLHYQNRIYSHAQDFQKPEETMTDFVQAAFSFCEAWLSGEEIYIQETSGSTGSPKKLSIHRNQMIASAEATGSFLKASANWKLLCCLNPAYIAGKMMLVRAMVWNCEIELVAPRTNPFKESFFKTEFDFVAMVPLQVETILEDSSSAELLKTIENLIIGGAPISQKLQKQLVIKNINAFQTFGMTETASHFALAGITEKELIYQALPGVQIGVNSHKLLWVSSAMSGPDPIQTNDVVDLVSENRFRWLGRSDFVINSGGVKLHPELIEQKAEIQIHHFFPEVPFFFGSLPDDSLGQKLTLFLETESSNEKKAKDLKVSLRSTLDRFEVPKEIVFKKRFQRTSNGKLDRLKTINEL
jgi:O-succinylbenzoic acid--CoA ligase